MIEELDIMRRLFDRYGLSNPLPVNIQYRALRMKRKNFVSVMKKLGIYSPLYGMILAFYLFFKKIGIGFSVMQSAIMFFTAVAISVASFTAGGYVLVKTVMGKKTSIKLEMKKQVGPATGHVAKSGEAAGGSNSLAYRYRVQFYGLENNGAETPLVAQISDIMRNEIIRLKGREKIAFTAADDAGLVLTGSIEKLDRQYLLSVRLTDRRTRRIIFAASEESVTVEGLRGLAVKFAQSIEGNIQ